MNSIFLFPVGTLMLKGFSMLYLGLPLSLLIFWSISRIKKIENE